MKYIDVPFAFLGFCLGLVFFPQPVSSIIPTMGLGLLTVLVLSIVFGLVTGYVFKR